MFDNNQNPNLSKWRSLARFWPENATGSYKSYYACLISFLELIENG